MFVQNMSLKKEVVGFWLIQHESLKIWSTSNNLDFGFSSIIE